LRRSLDVPLPTGERLAASLELPDAPQPVSPAVLMCHGLTGHKAEDGRLFVRLARALAASGVASLRFDFRGSGDSDGDFAGVTLESELEDARAALGALSSEPSVDRGRLGVVGLSLGSTVAMLLAGERRDLGALVLWAAVTEPAALFPPEAGPEPRAGWPMSAGFRASCARAAPLEALARYAGPLLCVHGTRDYVPRAWAEAAVATSRHAESRLELVEGDHTFGGDANKARAVELTRSWLVRALAPAPATS
jgi:uncharacterized protein